MKPFRTAILMATTALLLLGAGGRRKLWDLDLSKLTNRQAELIWGIAFSPDETKVAIGFGSSWQSDPDPRHIIVVAVDHPRAVLREFQLNTGPSPYPSGDSLVWSPSGTVLVATRARLIFRLDGKASCAFPEGSIFRGFLSEDRMVIKGPQKLTEIQILGPDCSVTDSWKIDGLPNVLGTSPEQDLLAIQTSMEARNESAIQLVVSRTHEVKQHWIWDLKSAFRGGFLFSNRGRVICSANPRRGNALPDVACWDTQTGAMTAENDKVGLDQLGIESAGGDLLAITDYKYTSRPWKSLWKLLDLSSEAVVPRRRLVWDVWTGKEIAEWEVLQQKELRGKDLKSASTTKSNFVLSLSTSGKYIAEGGAGSVSVYWVQP